MTWKIDKLAILDELQNTLSSFKAIGDKYGCTGEYVRLIAQRAGMEHGRVRKKMRTHQNHARVAEDLREEFKSVTNTKLEFIQDEARRRGFEVIPIRRSMRTACYREKVFTINGKLCMQRECHKLATTNKSRRNLYSSYTFSTPPTADLIFFLQHLEKETRLFIVPVKDLPAGAHSLYIPVHFRDVPYNNNIGKTDWRKYRDNWEAVR